MAQNIGTLLGAAVRPADSLDQFPAFHADEGKGGFYSVADLTTRDAIFNDRRVIGMRVKVISEDKDYELVGGITNGDWVEKVYGGGVSTFTDLTDTPSTYTGQSGKKVVVNAGETALEFVEDDTNTQDLQSVTENGNTTTESVTIEGSLTLGDGTYSYLQLANGYIEDEVAQLNLSHENVISLKAPITLTKGNPIVSIGLEEWNATTNTPELANTDTYKHGLEFVVNVAGTQDFGAGDITFGVGDIVANNGTIWYKKVNNNQGGGTVPTQTSDLTNDGADGTSTYVETDELGAVAFSNDYDDLNNKPNLVSLLREELVYTSGSQTFTLNNNYSQVYSVEVQGQGALSLSQYTLTSPNQLTINDTLDNGDYIVVIYTTAPLASTPYYTQAQVDSIFSTINKTSIGLGEVDNTSDLDKPISTTQQTAFDTKQDKAEIQTSSFTADFDKVYNCRGTFTITNPTDIINKSYEVRVLGGAVTIGSQVFQTGSNVHISYNGSTFDYNLRIDIKAVPLTQVAGAITIDSSHSYRTIELIVGTTPTTVTISEETKEVYFIKNGTATVTFESGAGRTLIQMNSVNTINTNGSVALVISSGTTDRLFVNDNTNLNFIPLVNIKTPVATVASFSGNPTTATVTFDVPYPSGSNYNVQPEFASFESSWRVTSKTDTGFTFSINQATAPTADINFLIIKI